MLLSSPVDQGRGQNEGDADADLVLVEEAVVGNKKKRQRELGESRGRDNFRGSYLWSEECYHFGNV